MPARALPRVWIADDSPAEAAAVREALKGRFSVETFHDGTELVERAATSPPAVMVLDWHMPGMNGLDVCRFLRTQPATMDTGILILTAVHPRTSDAVEALGAGANDYLAKPFENEEFVARGEALLRAQERRVRASETDILFSRMLDQLADAVLAMDAQGCLTFALDRSLPGWSRSRDRARPRGAPRGHRERAQ